MKLRQAVLGAVAVALGVVVVADRLGYLTSLPSLESFSGAFAEEAERRRILSEIRHLKGYELAAAEIESRYSEAALPYAQSIALVRALQLAPGDPRSFAAESVRAVVAAGPAEDVQVTAAQPVGRGGGIYEVLLSVDFETDSDRHAVRTIMELGRPEYGSTWQELSVTAVPAEKSIRVSGRLRTLTVEVAE